MQNDALKVIRVMRECFRVSLGVAIACCVIGCASTRPAVTEERRPESVYSRAELHFENSYLFKPHVGDTQRVEVLMAPLILREVDRNVRSAAPRGFQPSEVIATGENGREAVVYFRRGSVMFSGRPHPQIAYYWLNDTNTAGDCVLPMQGIRLTLDEMGAPIVWEVLADCSGAELLFVSEAFEAAVRERMGRPLPGRKFASEQSNDLAPAAVVARVLDDGPAAMGPIVYLRAAGDVGTVICRCMPAQADRLEGQREYELLELTASQEAELLASRIAQFQPMNVVSFEQWFWPDRLNERLRTF